MLPLRSTNQNFSSFSGCNVTCDGLLAAQKSHRKIAVTTVAANPARNHSAAEIARFFSSSAAKRSLAANDFGFRKAFQPEFGAHRGLAWVLKSPSNPQNCRKKEKNPGKGHFCFLRQTLVCSKPWFKRDLRVSLEIAGSSQRPWPQVAAAARFRGRSDHGTLRMVCARRTVLESSRAPSYQCYFLLIVSYFLLIVCYFLLIVCYFLLIFC